MKKTWFILLMCAVIFLGTSCKSKQKAVAITGAQIEAKDQNAVTKTSVTTSTKTTVAEATPVEEVTRNEKFSIPEGESNNGAFSFKYHVVVGSFSVRQNAKNLQDTLIKEGNNAMVVINDKQMYRVIISSFNEYYQAKNRINEISNRFPDAWVLVQK